MTCTPFLMKKTRPPKSRRPRNSWPSTITPNSTPHSTATQKTQLSCKTTLTTTSSVVFKNNTFLTRIYRQITKDAEELEYQRLKFNRLPDEEKKKQKSVSVLILNMITDTNSAIIEGESCDLGGFDGTDPDETDLLMKKIRIILPKKWSEGMGLMRFTVVKLYYPLNVTRTKDERLYLDNIFWIQVIERGDPNQEVREPIEVQIHKWDCVCQVSSERIVPLCDPIECQLRLQASIEARMKAAK